MPPPRSNARMRLKASGRIVARQHLLALKAGQMALQIADHLDAMMAYWDRNLVCVFVNQAYQSWFGKSRAQIVGVHMQELLGPLYDLNLPYIEGALRGAKQVFERRIPLPDGSVRHCLATYIPHFVNDVVQGIFVHVADVSMLKTLESHLLEAKERLEQLATHDYLTGLPNRVLLMDRMRQALAMSERNHEPLAVLSIDVDNFKQINDRLGHAAGDRYLVEVARRLTASLRGYDSATRVGGDEFLVIAPCTRTAEDARTLASRILEASRQPFALDQDVLTPTLSIGIAMHPAHGTDAQALINASDRALYRAKRQGKNCCAWPD